MKDSEKAKEQLITELQQLRQQIAQLKSTENSREQMWKALEESEKRYRDVVEDQTELICRFLPGGKLTFVNEACCRFLCRRRDELMGHSFIPLILGEDCERVRKHIASLTHKNFVMTHEHCVLVSGSESRWLEWTIRAIFGKRSRAIEFQAVGRDITERKQVEKKLRQSEEKYRTLVSRIPGHVWTSDDKLRIIFFGPQIEKLTGYTEDHFPLGATWANWYRRVHPDDVKEAMEAFVELMRTGRPYDIEYRFRKKDREWIWVNERSVGTYEKDGRLYADGLVSDITERKQVEEEIKKLKEKYESVIRNIPDAIYSCLPNDIGAMVFISERYKDWTGYPPQDFYRDPELRAKTIHPEDRDTALETYIEACRNKKTYLYEYRVIHKDTGQICWVRDHGMPVTDDCGKLVLFDGLISNITERKQMEEKLNIFQQRLRSLASQISVAEEKERRRLAAGLHDQVTQTLAVIKLKLGALQKESSFNNHSKQLNEIRDLVDGAIQETRSLTFELSPPILYELGLEAAVEWLTEQFQEHYGIECEFRDDGQLKPLGDEHRGILFAAIRELLINVVKHSQARTARVSFQRERNEIRVEVQDDGVGFSPLEMGQQPKAFGLFNIRERLNYLGGHVEIESERSRGTLVTLIAPLLGGG